MRLSFLAFLLVLGLTLGECAPVDQPRRDQAAHRQNQGGRRGPLKLLGSVGKGVINGAGGVLKTAAHVVKGGANQGGRVLNGVKTGVGRHVGSVCTAVARYCGKAMVESAHYVQGGAHHVKNAIKAVGDVALSGTRNQRTLVRMQQQMREQADAHNQLSHRIVRVVESQVNGGILDARLHTAQHNNLAGRVNEIGVQLNGVHQQLNQMHDQIRQGQQQNQGHPQHPQRPASPNSSQDSFHTPESSPRN